MGSDRHSFKLCLPILSLPWSYTHFPDVSGERSREAHLFQEGDVQWFLVEAKNHNRKEKRLYLGFWLPPGYVKREKDGGAYFLLLKASSTVVKIWHGFSTLFYLHSGDGESDPPGV
ncbi:Hypothetical protein NTJ_01027 [Nesidiocoris tenuis]|uniref:Uncharacterized protein n=1 Tax=Nesidiocoris tenuis TaxID=355587 RepID=A0ABN7A7H2_9HEMI|nr:Hypothetical protein NTJ_01027 [Nesidiocoris tenuis]